MGKRVKDCIVHLLFHTHKPVACPLLSPLPSHCDPNCHLLWECVMASLCMSERERESGLKGKEKPWSKAPFTEEPLSFFNSLISWLVRSEWERFFYEEGGKNRRLGQPGVERRRKGILATVPSSSSSSSSSPNPALLHNSLVFSFGSVKRACPMEKTVWKGSVECGRGPSVCDI